MIFVRSMYMKARVFSLRGKPATLPRRIFLLIHTKDDHPSRARSAPASMPNDIKYKAIVVESCRGLQAENASSPREPAYPFISSYP